MTDIHAKNKKILFINPAFCQAGNNAAGIANLRGFLESKNVKTDVIDYNKIIGQDKNKLYDLNQYKDYLLSHIPTEIAEYVWPQKKINLFTLSEFYVRFHSIYEKEGMIMKTIDECRLLDRIFDDAPVNMLKFDYIGISIGYDHQLLFSFLLADYLKRSSAGKINVIVGGPKITHDHSGIKLFFKKTSLFDHMIVGEGQTALYELLCGNKPLEKIPNLIYYKNDKFCNSQNSCFYENYPELPPPIYKTGDLPCVQLSRKCYWNKCRFCHNFDTTFNIIQSESTIKKTLNDIKVIQKQINPTYYNFLDSAVPSNLLKHISESIADDPELLKNYRAFLRFDPAINRSILSKAKRAGFGKGGAGKLVFGLETSSSRLLKVVNKGISLDNVKKIINICSDLRLNIQINLIYCLPTQTKEELIQDMEYVSGIIDSYNDKTRINFVLSSFDLIRGSEFYKNPSKYGIKILSKNEKSLSHSVPFVFTDKNNVNVFQAEQIINEYISKNNLGNNIALTSMNYK